MRLQNVNPNGGGNIYTTMDLQEPLGTDPANRPELVQILNGIFKHTRPVRDARGHATLCVRAYMLVFGVFEVNTATDGVEQLGHRLLEILHATRGRKKAVSGSGQVERPGRGARFASIRTITASGNTSR